MLDQAFFGGLLVLAIGIMLFAGVLFGLALVIYALTRKR
jgi:hypothetical protein